MSKKDAGPTAGKLPAEVPIFASVMSPAFNWNEYETRTLRGSTHIPKKSKDAYVEVPSLASDTPDARAVRTHEMLHIAFTPTINPVAARLAKEGLGSGVVLQLTEDMRLAHIAQHNGLIPRDAYFSQETVLGLVNQLLDSAQSASAVPGCEQSLAVAVASTLGAMYGQSFDVEGGLGDLESNYLCGNVERLCMTAEAAYGITGREALGRVFEGNERAVEAARSMYDHANKLGYMDIPEGETRRARIKREQATFEDLYRHTHEVLEALLYDEEPPKGEPKREDGAGEGASGGASPPWDEPKDEPKDTPEKDKAEEEPKTEDKPEGDSENGDAEKEAAPDKPVEKPSKEKVKDNKIASGAIDKAEMMMGKSISSAAGDYLRRKAKSDVEARVRSESSTPDVAIGVPGMGGPTGDSIELTAVVNLNISMDTSTSVNWAPMDIVSPPLERSFKVRVPRRGRPSLDGEIPRHWSRWFADRAILDNRGRRLGGTLLVDVSGSMSWSREQTMALINATPAMTIALYSSGEDTELRPGGSYYTGRGFRGRLTIIARQGRAVAAEYKWRDLHGPSNACDGPALAWLARQPAPRVWFSDGEVTVMRGDGEVHGGTPAIEDATRIIKLGNITRTVDKSDVVRIFSGLAPVHHGTSKDCGPRLATGHARSVFTLMAAKRWNV